MIIVLGLYGNSEHLPARNMLVWIEAKDQRVTYAILVL